MNRTSVVRAALPLLILAAAREAPAQNRRYNSGYESRVDTTFAFDKNGSVSVSATNGNIVVNGWSRDQIRIHAVSDDDNIRFSGSSSRVTLDVGGSRRGSDTRFELSVPYGARVTAESRTGDITVRGTRGQVEARAQNGDVEVDEVTTRFEASTFSGDIVASGITGDISVSSLSGDVRLSDARGTVDAGSVSGDIDLRGVTSRLVRAKSTSGDIGFNGGIDPAGRYELTSHSGDIALRIPRDASAQLTISTWNGAIDSDFPITLKPGEHGIGRATTKRYAFDIGGGAARITAETFSGDITISSNGRGSSERP